MFDCEGMDDNQLLEYFEDYKFDSDDDFDEELYSSEPEEPEEPNNADITKCIRVLFN